MQNTEERAAPQSAIRNMMSVAEVLQVVGSALQRERGRINALESFGGPGTYGDRMARAWSQAAGTVRRAGTGDVGRDLALAAQVVSDVAGGQSGRFYRQGLLRAAARFAGQPGLTLADLGPLLTELLAGAQENNPAQPGQGTLLDVLIPATAAYTTCKQQGLTEAQALQAAVGAAAMGRKRTARLPPVSGGKARAGKEDPGAAAAEIIVAGLIRGLL